MIVHLAPADDHTRMLEIEDDHHKEHERGIEDVKIDLRTEKNSALTAGILGYAEDASDHDEKTGKVEDPEIACPRDSRCHGRIGWCGVHSLVPGCRDHDEEGEESDLEEQTGKDNIVGKFAFVLRLRFSKHAATYEDFESVREVQFDEYPDLTYRPTVRRKTKHLPQRRS